MNWRECRLKKFVKKIKTDKQLIKSLLIQSKRKLITDKFSPLNKDTASTKVSINYDSLREVLEAIAVKNEFKIYNHDCFFGFLKEVLKLEKESFDFDKFRRIRNSINYYGKDVSIEDSKRLIRDMRKLRIKLIKEYLE